MLLQYCWPHSLCCDSDLCDLFYPWRFVSLNPLHLFWRRCRIKRETNTQPSGNSWHLDMMRLKKFIKGGRAGATREGEDGGSKGKRQTNTHGLCLPSSATDPLEGWVWETAPGPAARSFMNLESAVYAIQSAKNWGLQGRGCTTGGPVAQPFKDSTQEKRAAIDRCEAGTVGGGGWCESSMNNQVESGPLARNSVRALLQMG